MTDSDSLDDLSEKEILVEIFREVRATKRVLIWAFVVAPILYAYLVLIAIR